MVLDHSKINQVSFCKFAGLKDINYFITDEISSEYEKKLQELGTEVIL